MKLPEKIIAAAFAVAVALQAWTLKTVVELKISVAQIETRLEGFQRRNSEQTQASHARNP